MTTSSAQAAAGASSAPSKSRTPGSAGPAFLPSSGSYHTATMTAGPPAPAAMAASHVPRRLAPCGGRPCPRPMTPSSLRSARSGACPFSSPARSPTRRGFIAATTCTCRTMPPMSSAPTPSAPPRTPSWPSRPEPCARCWPYSAAP